MLPAQEALAGEEGQVAAHRGLGNPKALGQLPGTQGPVVAEQGQEPWRRCTARGMFSLECKRTCVILSRPGAVAPGKGPAP